MLFFKTSIRNLTKIASIATNNKPGDTLTVQGWIKNIRRLKNNIFLDVNDGSTNQKFQIVLPKNDTTNKSVTTGSVIKAMGHIQIAPNGHYELHADEVHSLADGHINEAYPFTPKQQHPPEYVREYLHLRSRVDYIAAQMRIRHKAHKIIHDYMDENGFVHIHTPILTTNDCEGAGEVFTVCPNSKELLKQMSRTGIPLEQSYFDEKVYLSVSGQLHLEAMSYGLGNTYNFAPAFRSENCKSPLHLSEFYMFEAELVYMEEIKQLTDFIESMLKATITRLMDLCASDISFCQKKSQAGSSYELDFLEKPWHILKFDEAAEIILKNKAKFSTEVNPANGFSKEQELFLVDYCKSPVFLVDWPTKQKPFYMRTIRNNPDYVHALDLLMPNVGELCGGSLREFDLNRLMKHPDLPKDLHWYLEIRKFGGIPTGGFGMGFERYLQLLTGVKNIRDVIPFPRYPHSCKM